MGQPPGVQRRQQVGRADERAAAEVDHARARRQASQQRAIHEVPCLPGQRQQADEDVGAADHLIEAVAAAEGRHAGLRVEPLQGAAPALDTEACLAQDVRRGLPERAQSEQPDAPVRRRHVRQLTPLPRPLLREVGGHVAVQVERPRQHCFSHRPCQLRIDHAHDRK